MNDILWYILSSILGLITIVMWYFYGAIDSINDDTLENKKDRYTKRLLRFVAGYHTNLFMCVMTYSFVTIFVATQVKFGWIVAILVLIFAVFFRHIGYSKAEKLNSMLSSFANLFYIISMPVVYILVIIVDILSKMVKLDVKTIYETVTEDEIISLINDGHEQGVLEKEEAEMISNIVELGDKEAMDIMVHRKNVFALEVGLTLKEIAHIILSKNYSRYPVYSEEMDNILGILHLRDFFAYYNSDNVDYNEKLANVSDIIKQAYLVPTTKSVNEIFKEMKKEKKHMGIVVDEYGQLDGILTMEDIIEEIMGSILDEYDNDENFIIDQGDDVYLVSGTCPLELLSEKIPVEFGEEFETLSGFLISKINRIPKENEVKIEVEYEGYIFKLQRVNSRTIQLVKIRKKQKEGEL